MFNICDGEATGDGEVERAIERAGGRVGGAHKQGCMSVGGRYAHKERGHEMRCDADAPMGGVGIDAADLVVAEAVGIGGDLGDDALSVAHYIDDVAGERLV